MLFAYPADNLTFHFLPAMMAFIFYFFHFFSIYNLEFSEDGWSQTMKTQPHGLYHATKSSTRAFCDRTSPSMKNVASKYLRHFCQKSKNCWCMLEKTKFSFYACYHDILSTFVFFLNLQPRVFRGLWMIPDHKQSTTWTSSCNKSLHKSFFR